jgi:hypothetical protein
VRDRGRGRRRRGLVGPPNALEVAPCHRPRNNVAITADIHDMAAAQAMMTSPSAEAAAQMESHGVVSPQTAYVEK